MFQRAVLNSEQAVRVLSIKSKQPLTVGVKENEPEALSRGNSGNLGFIGIFDGILFFFLSGVARNQPPSSLNSRSRGDSRHRMVQKNKQIVRTFG